MLNELIQGENSFSRGQLWIVSAPSGGGKTSLIADLVENVADVIESISYTTRPMRPHEKDGRDYFFISPERFQQMAEEGVFLEYERVFNHYYATSRVLVEKWLQAGKDVVLNIDWQGAERVRQRCPDVRSVFIIPPSLQALRERLMRRGQDHPEVVEQRMADAVAQISHYRHFDYLILNDDFTRAAHELKALIIAARLERERRIEKLTPLLNALLTP